MSRVQVVPITSNVDRLYPSEACASLRGQRRKAMADQLGTVAKERLSARLGRLSHTGLEAVERAVLLQLGIETP